MKIFSNCWFYCPLVCQIKSFNENFVLLNAWSTAYGILYMPYKHILSRYLTTDWSSLSTLCSKKLPFHATQTAVHPSIQSFVYIAGFSLDSNYYACLFLGSLNNDQNWKYDVEFSYQRERHNRSNFLINYKITLEKFGKSCFWIRNGHHAVVNIDR